MNIKLSLYLLAVCLLPLLHACDDDADRQAYAEYLEKQIAATDPFLQSLNASILCQQDLLSGALPVGVTVSGDGYMVDLSNGANYEIVSGSEVDAYFPLVTISKEGNWSYSFDGTAFYPFTDLSGKAINAYSLDDMEAIYRSPQLRIDTGGFWQVTCDGGSTYQYLSVPGQERIAAFGATGVGLTSLFSAVTYNEAARQLALVVAVGETRSMFPVITDFYLHILGSDTEEDRTFFLGEVRKYEVEEGDVVKTKIEAPQDWEVTLLDNELSIKAPASVTANGKTETVKFVITSSKHYLRTVRMEVKLLNETFDAAYCTAWKEFVSGSANNVLLDFSYAGYMHGEVAPPDVYGLGYQVINVQDFGAVPDDGKSDRQAFIDAIKAAGGRGLETKPDEGKNGGVKVTKVRLEKTALNAIIYFPPGEYILQDESEVNESIHLTMGNFVIKGAGRDKTFIRMNAPNKLNDGDEMWTCPTMIQIKHYSDGTKLADVTTDAAKGTFSATVSSTSGIKVGDYVCLSLHSYDPELVAKEVAPHPVSDFNPIPSIMKTEENDGVEVFDLHQIKSISGNVVTFVEPIMHEVEARYGWTLNSYPHYENVGVEDLAFVGKAEAGFLHHKATTSNGSFDAEYKLIDFTRLVNSWVRRVDFISVSEAASWASCANVSAYDIDISGNRGHSAIRSNSSSRVFIGKVTDHSDGNQIITATQLGGWMEGAGQYHGCGVSKPSMGAVIWNVRWGDDGCYEAHASQPRATLIDRCEGAFIPSRQGGSEYEVPNHLGDLIIWNMNATRTDYESNWDEQFVFWDKSSRWCKTVPPVIVGFHGADIRFAETFISDVPQTKRIESQGTAVEPYSLYEAQLRRRLGYVPAWLSALK